MSGRQSNSETGLTLVESIVAMSILTVVLAITLAATVQVREAYVRIDDEASGQMDVRTAVERLGRDLRIGRGLEASATASQLEMWIDYNSDYRRSTSEIVSWRLEPTGSGQFNVVRTLGGVSVTTSSSVIEGLAFCYKVEATDSDCLATPLSTGDAAKAKYVETTIKYDDRHTTDEGSAARTLMIAERMRNVG